MCVCVGGGGRQLPIVLSSNLCGRRVVDGEANSSHRFEILPILPPSSSTHYHQRLDTVFLATFSFHLRRIEERKGGLLMGKLDHWR